jgi:hypothetical protein
MRLFYVPVRLGFMDFSLFCGMIRRKILLMCLFILPAMGRASAQDLCDAVNTIARDAPNKFRNIAGKVLASSADGASWESGIKVPGTIASRFVKSMGLFYEGALYQSGTADGLDEQYNKWLTTLETCLVGAGYNVSFQDNFQAGLEKYKKVVFLLDDPNGIPQHDHMSLEVLYNKDSHLYTIVMYIFER